MMHEYLIALGANLGDREYYIHKAIEAIRTSCGPIQGLSTLIETEAMGAADQPFLNGALICSSHRTPESMLDQLLAIERDLGRTRELRWGNRTIDLDIILWKDPEGKFAAVKTPTLSIPHPELVHRLFVLEPAQEIAANWLHASEQQTIAQLYQRLKNCDK